MCRNPAVPVQHVNAQLQGSAGHCNTDSFTLRHVALFTNYFSSFTLAGRKELVLSGHDDALWLWSAPTLITSCLQKVGKVQAPRGNLLPEAAVWSALEVLLPGNQTNCKFGVVATCGIRGLKNLPTRKSLVFTYNYVQLITLRISSM